MGEVNVLVIADVVVSRTLWLGKVNVLILGVKEKQWKKTRKAIESRAQK